MNETNTPVLRLDSIRKSFNGNEVLKGISFDVHQHEVVALLGPSGSGKSTLMKCVNLLEQVDDGQIWLADTDITDPRVKQDEIRSRIGVVFQQFNLFPHMSVMKNVTLAAIKVHHWPKEKAETRALELLDRIGMRAKASAYPDQLSGGQQQRVSIARALVRNPAVILADEPTGALDSHTGREVLGMLQQMHDEGHTVVLITHDNSIAVQADRIIRLEDGRVVYDGDAHAPEAVVQPTLLPETPDEEEKA